MSKNEFLKQIEVRNPCSENWNEMTGTQQVRFCSHCDLHVNNLSAMTRKQAMKLVRESDGRLCVRYVQNPVDKTPIFADRFYQITRRARIAAGVLGASLALSALTYAQNDVSKVNTDAGQITQNQRTDENFPVTQNGDVKQDVQIDAGEYVTMGVMVVSEYYNPLHQAVSEDDLELVTELIAKGEKVNGKDENYSNITPLFLAVDNGNLVIAETLLNFGAKVNFRNDEKQTPLMRLDEDAKIDIVQLLIKHRAEVNLADQDGNTALIFAAEHSTAEVLQELINSGADINRQNKDGETALMKAAEADNLEKVRVLLLAGADVDLKDKEGGTAWDAADEEEVEKLLESYGAKTGEN